MKPQLVVRLNLQLIARVHELMAQGEALQRQLTRAQGLRRRAMRRERVSQKVAVQAARADEAALAELRRGHGNLGRTCDRLKDAGLKAQAEITALRARVKELEAQLEHAAKSPRVWIRKAEPAPTPTAKSPIEAATEEARVGVANAVPGSR